MANEIHKKDFKNTFIGYRVKGEEHGAYWATTNYEPDLKVFIYGSTKQSHEALKALDVNIEDELVGAWLVNWGYEYKSFIYKNEGKVVIRTLFSDGSGQVTELFVNTVNGQIRYYEEDGELRGEYYTVSNNGELQFWSENGNYYTAPKID